ncbi:MAG: hypothetical protein RIC55_08185 [Pirellulaceae bacterium]
MFQPPLPPTRPLSLPELQKRVETHNNQQLLFGILLIAGSLFAWIISFAILVWFFSFFFAIVGIPSIMALVPALLGVAALVAFGVWNATSILRQDDDYLIEHLAGSAFTESHGFGVIWARIMGYAIVLTILVEILLCAPRTAVMAIQAFRSVITIDEPVLQQACSIRQQLFENRDLQRWMPLDNFTAWPHALVLLHRLKLITVDDRDGMVRLAS